MASSILQHKGQLLQSLPPSNSTLLNDHVSHFGTQSLTTRFDIAEFDYKCTLFAFEEVYEKLMISLNNHLSAHTSL